jgi:putative transposase
MSSYRRVSAPGGLFFFTVVTHARAPIFTTDDRVERLREAFRQVRATRPFTLEAMVVLPDHLHCLWRLPVGDGDYPGRWREIKKAASRTIAPRSNARRERAVWQRRYWEHAVRNHDDWRRHLDYIHYNPVKHGLVARPQDWPWSSFGRYVARGWYEVSWGSSEPADIAGLHFE